jgi:hypothetical protein
MGIVKHLGPFVGRYSIQNRWKRQLPSIFGKTWKPQNVYYWRRKIISKKFHQSTWGGTRTRKFSESELLDIKSKLWLICKSNPTTHIHEYQRKIRTSLQLNISETYIRNIFKSWRWSWKNVEYKQTHKYKPENIARYGKYLLWVAEQDWKKLKFLDEAHFVNRSKKIYLN